MIAVFSFYTFKFILQYLIRLLTIDLIEKLKKKKKKKKKKKIAAYQIDPVSEDHMLKEDTHDYFAIIY